MKLNHCNSAECAQLVEALTAKANAYMEMMDANAKELDRLMAQEPYGYFRYDIQLDAWVQNKEANVGVAFYTEPAKREWVGLTDEERHACTQSPFTADNYLAIEAKLKEKNT